MTGTGILGMRRAAVAVARQGVARRALSGLARPGTAHSARKRSAFHSVSGLQQSLSPQREVRDHTDTASELNRMNHELENLQNDPLAVLRWAVSEFDGRLAMSTSFGIQSAVLLHLATQVKPDIPVVWVDTGYLPVETYQYAQELSETLNLNLHVASNREWTAARMEALYGKLWEKDDAESHALYGRMRKVEPMNESLDALEPNPLVLLSGLRASQTKARANMPPVGFQNGRFKLLPILKMNDDDVAEYMDRHDLPAHPLQAKNYVTVGDWHSSRPVQEGEDPRNTRFGGKFQECGLHVESHEPVEAAPAAPAAPAAEAQEVEAQEVEAALLPESLEATGIKALGLTKAHPETDLAVIMVKKLTEDGSFCRKCNDVADKIESDNLARLIGHTSVADVLDSTSEGSVLAKHFGVATAPFFLVRDLDAERKRGEWKVVRSYLQLRKMLEKAADHKLLVEEQNRGAAAPLEQDPVYSELTREAEALQLQVEQLQLELREKRSRAEAVRKQATLRASDLGVDQ